jgi:HD superfamily phosphohydrolase
LEFSDRIVDNVHGLINITQVEKEIIDLPIFKRLQHIKQQTLVSRIFPGAEHTRYSHSLGVMHIADKIAVKLNFNDNDRQLIRLAGLLHDIGHYPFSHSGESSYTIKEFDKIDFSYNHYKNDVFEKIDKVFPFEINEAGEQEFNLTDDYMKQSPKRFHHELVGQRILLSDRDILGIINKHCPYIDNIKDICDIITGIIRKPELAIHVQKFIQN